MISNPLNGPSKNKNYSTQIRKLYIPLAFLYNKDEQFIGYNVLLEKKNHHSHHKIYTTIKIKYRSTKVRDLEKYQICSSLNKTSKHNKVHSNMSAFVFSNNAYPFTFTQMQRSASTQGKQCCPGGDRTE